MDLICYLQEGWAPLIRPAPATRPWMDDTPEAFAYRCLPLNIANAHGWELLSPCGFDAVWDGGGAADAVVINVDPGTGPERAPVALFGQGVITFHVDGIFRTPPGWNLWVGGSPNRPKDGVAPLTGIIETDWSPFTFTMNWRFTRPGHRVRFEPGEPFCFLFPVQRGAVEFFAPALASLESDPATRDRFNTWSRERDAFHERMRTDPPKAPADRWQKHYYRGVDLAGEALVDDHQSKLRLRGFDRTAAPLVPIPPAGDAALPKDLPAVAVAPAAAAAAETNALRLALAKREWLLETLERQRDLAPQTVGIERREGLESDEFLEQYYAVNRPVILVGEMSGWPALSRWTPDYLKAKLAGRLVEYQGGRSENPLFEMEKDRHRRTAPFETFIDEILAPHAGNDCYLTAFNSERNRDALAPLFEDLGPLDKFLKRDGAAARGMPWIGPAGTVTSLHHDLTNNFIAQVVGSKRLKILPAAESGKVYNYRHVFSEIPDLEDPRLDIGQRPRLAGARIYEVALEPGEILFMPVGWWHQVKSTSFSVTITYTDFLWPNDAYATYPSALEAELMA